MLRSKKKLQYANHNIVHSPEEVEELINNGAKAYEAYLDALGFDWRNDPNSADTPRRVAKAFVTDLAMGCYTEPPKVTAFDNVDEYDGMVCQNNIKVVITADHSTPCKLKSHSADPVPVLFYNGSIPKEKKFNENEARKGNLGRINGKELLAKVKFLK